MPGLGIFDKDQWAATLAVLPDVLKSFLPKEAIAGAAQSPIRQQIPSQAAHGGTGMGQNIPIGHVSTAPGGGAAYLNVMDPQVAVPPSVEQLGASSAIPHVSTGFDPIRQQMPTTPLLQLQQSHASGADTPPPPDFTSISGAEGFYPEAAAETKPSRKIDVSHKPTVTSAEPGKGKSSGSKDAMAMAAAQGLSGLLQPEQSRLYVAPPTGPVTGGTFQGVVR